MHGMSIYAHEVQMRSGSTRNVHICTRGTEEVWICTKCLYMHTKYGGGLDMHGMSIYAHVVQRRSGSARNVHICTRGTDDVWICTECLDMHTKVQSHVPGSVSARAYMDAVRICTCIFGHRPYMHGPNMHVHIRTASIYARADMDAGTRPLLLSWADHVLMV